MIELNIKIDPMNLNKTALLETARYIASFAGQGITVESAIRQPANPPIQQPSLPATTVSPGMAAALSVPRAPVAPSAPSVPPAPPLAANGDLDVKGEAWDTKIHTRTKSKNPDGTWKLKRGTEPTDFKVISETRGDELSEDVFAQEDAILTSQQLSSLIVDAIRDKRLTHGRVLEILKSEGLLSLPALASRPDLVPAVYEKLAPYFV